MSEEIMDIGATDAQKNQGSGKVYTQEEFDNHMAGLKRSITAKYEKTFQDLGDIEELRQLKRNAEVQKEQEALKRGEFEKILKEKTTKWQSEIETIRQELMEYKVNMPIVDAAAKYKAVAPHQVKELLHKRVRVNESNVVEVLDDSGQLRYDDRGNPYSVETLVKEFLDQNPHFVQAGAAATNTKSSVAPTNNSNGIDLNSLDLTRADHRKIYKEARDKGLI